MDKKSFTSMFRSYFAIKCIYHKLTPNQTQTYDFEVSELQIKDL